MPCPAEQSLIDACAHLSLTNPVKQYGRGEADFPLLRVSNTSCTATLALQGAQLLDVCRSDGVDLLWLSPQANFSQGSAVRGGIPLCLPWFGPHGEDPSKPQHGFARILQWRLTDAQALGADATRLWLSLEDFHSQPHPLFPHRFSAELCVTLSTQIELQLTVTNYDSSPMPLSWALHSYHPVEPLAEVAIGGLEGCTYLDNTCQGERHQQVGPIEFEAELDRLYLDVGSNQVIRTANTLEVSADNCASAIVWNPGPQLAAQMADVGAGNHLGFVCLERGNAADNALLLAPGSSHQARVSIRASNPD